MDRIGPKNPPQHFLKEWRKHLGLTQEKVAERLDTTKGQISLYERNKRKMTLEMAAAFAFAMNPDLDSLAIFRHPDEPSADEKLRNATPEQRRAALTVIDSIMSMGTGTDG
ncbi:MAG: helix-turn-helix transcriptional regulator [Pseudomonadota bacterium]